MVEEEQLLKLIINNIIIIRIYMIIFYQMVRFGLRQDLVKINGICGLKTICKILSYK